MAPVATITLRIGRPEAPPEPRSGRTAGRQSVRRGAAVQTAPPRSSRGLRTAAAVREDARYHPGHAARRRPTVVVARARTGARGPARGPPGRGLPGPNPPGRGPPGPNPPGRGPVGRGPPGPEPLVQVRQPAAHPDRVAPGPNPPDRGPLGRGPLPTNPPRTSPPGPDRPVFVARTSRAARAHVRAGADGSSPSALRSTNPPAHHAAEAPAVHRRRLRHADGLAGHSRQTDAVRRRSPRPSSGGTRSAFRRVGWSPIVVAVARVPAFPVRAGFGGFPPPFPFSARNPDAPFARPPRPGGPPPVTPRSRRRSRTSSARAHCFASRSRWRVASSRSMNGPASSPLAASAARQAASRGLLPMT